MTDRRGLLALVAGVVGLTLGAAAAVWDVVALAVVAGALALVAGVAAFRLFELLRSARTTIDALENQVSELETTAEREAKAREAADAERATSLAERIEARAVRESSEGDTTLTDTETGLYSEAYFLIAVDARIAAARRTLRPVSVVLLDVIDGLGTGAAHPATPGAIAAAIRSTLREADTACRLEDGSFALLLEDTAETGAIWTVERLRRAMADPHPEFTVWAGVSCYPAHGFEQDELLRAAGDALESAREWRQDRIEVALGEV